MLQAEDILVEAEIQARYSMLRMPGQ
jgi:hypothetical protein